VEKNEFFESPERKVREDQDHQLRIENVCTFYGEAQALKSVSITVNSNEVVAILGSNGAGKTTLLRTLTGFLTPRYGKITFRGESVKGIAPHRVIRRGIAAVPEGRELFGDMSVSDNLLLGTYSVNRRVRRQILSTRLEMIFNLFPVLRERWKQRAETLSGGEQQMLAVGRALMAEPKLLALDEPSLGLSPLLVMEMMKMLKYTCSNLEVSILLVEQNARAALKIAGYVYVLERGEVVLNGTCEELVASASIQRAYLGG
jgi:branched-chain amino acid transport system ATP-binding protein